jgi:hypothetical protein
MEKQNITLSIRKDVLQKVKIIAVKRNSSVSAMMTNLLEDIVALEEGYQTASQKHIRVLQQEVNLGTNGSVDWSRDELHAR